LKIRSFWDIAPCSLVGVDRRFRDAISQKDLIFKLVFAQLVNKFLVFR
jgi:hypothetical protein